MSTMNATLTDEQVAQSAKIMSNVPDSAKFECFARVARMLGIPDSAHESEYRRVMSGYQAETTYTGSNKRVRH